MQICIYEDEKYGNFFPLTYSRPVYELVCGINSLKEKITAEFPDANISLLSRKYLEDIVQLNNQSLRVNKIDDDECIFINGRISSIELLMKPLNKLGQDDIVYKNGNTILMAKLSGKNLQVIKNAIPDVLSSDLFTDLNSEETDFAVYNYLWEMISDNGKQIANDIERIIKQNKDYKNPGKLDSVSFVKEEKIFIGKDVTIKPGVVIDATNGPVLIDENVFIYPNAVIEGPVYVGKGTKIKSGATIYDNVSIGSVCKIGGEVEDSIILPFTNKQHSGFIGHSYLGCWVNLGAGTNCSDLKNNYSTVKVKLSDKTVDTKSQFLGVIIGDHSKTSINTMFNTGTIVGFSSNIFGAGFPSKYIPSFSWGGAEGFSDYDLKKSIETARIVLKRRNIEFMIEDEKLFESIFNLTVDERNG